MKRRRIPIHKVFILINAVLLLTGFIFSSYGQPRSFCVAYDDYRPYGYQTASRWETIRKSFFGKFGEDSLFHTDLSLRKEGIYMMCPWWIEDIYKRDTLAAYKCGTLGYIGYELDVWTGNQRLVNEWNAPYSEGVLDNPLYKDKELDLVVFCRSGRGFDYFLDSKETQINFLKRVFDIHYGAVMHEHNHKKTSGLNLYLPEFSFKEKRKFTQFIQSLYMVIHNYGVQLEGSAEVIRPCDPDNFTLTLTFPSWAKSETSYLATLTNFVDCINLADYNEYGLPPIEGITVIDSHNPAPIFSEIITQLYLMDNSKIYTLGEHDICNRISLLAQANYKTENWRLYIIIDMILLLFLITLIILYNTCSSFYMFVENYKSLLVPAIIVLGIEIVIVFMYAVEAVSKKAILFDIDNPVYYLFMIIPFVLFGIYAFFKVYFHEKVQP